MQEIVGAKIVGARVMTKEEQEAEGWDFRGDAVLLELDNGMRLYPSQDPEGNGPGCMFGTSKNGTTFRVSVL